MKKTVIIILAVLPIVMVIAIAFAGRIFSYYRYIPIEKVCFTDTYGNELDDKFTLTVNVGESKLANTRVFPDLASNKRVTFSSGDESICTVNQDGSVTGVSIGSTIVIVKTEDGGKTDLINVRVTDDYVRGVTLSEQEIELSVSETKVLIATVEPYSALNKNLVFSSSNTSVATVSANGKVTAVSSGSAVITVTTVDGGFSASCTVTVNENLPPLYFDFSSSTEIQAMGSGYIALTDTVDLMQYIRLGTLESDMSDVGYKITSGGSYASLSGSVLSFSGNDIVKIVVYIGDREAPTYQTEILVAYSN